MAMGRRDAPEVQMTPLPEFDIQRYGNAVDLTADIPARLKAGWGMHSWHPCNEVWHDRDPRTGELITYTGTYFYAMFVRQPEPPKPEPMAVR